MPSSVAPAGLRPNSTAGCSISSSRAASHVSPASAFNALPAADQPQSKCAHVTSSRATGVPAWRIRRARTAGYDEFMFDVLVYLYDNYWRPDACPEHDQLTRKL